MSTPTRFAALALTLLMGLSLTAPTAAADEPADEGFAAFVRAHEAEAKHLQLDIAIRRYEPADGDGPPIELVAVIHIADDAYYQALQEHLDQQPLVLFEGVGRPAFVSEEDDTDRDRANRTRHGLRFVAIQLERYHDRHDAYPADLDALLADVAEHDPGEARWTRIASRDNWGNPLHYQPLDDGYELESLGSDGEAGGEGHASDIDFARGHRLTPQEIHPADELQPGVADALGLSFQLHAMNYDRPNYQHADMTFTELSLAIAARRDDEELDLTRRRPDPLNHPAPGPGQHDQELDTLVTLMQGTQLTDALLKGTQRLLANNPSLQQLSRLLMIEVLGSIDGDLTAMPGLSPSMQNLMRVLIIDRNRVVVRELEQVLQSEDTPESISVFYGAGHMPDLARQLRELLDYQPTGEVRWLTAFSADLSDTELKPHQLEVLRGLIRFQMRSINP